MEMYRTLSNTSLNTNQNFISNKRSDIILPNQTEHIPHIAVDIGGSLAKVVWFSIQPDGAGRLNFAKFETSKIDQCIGFLQGLLTERQDSRVRIRATGGGAHKFYDLFTRKLAVTLQKEDEMECLITGLNFLVRQIAYEVFTYDERRPDPIQFESTSKELFPYMVVNIGSGVSILKVTSDETYERIGGTSLGGGTLWGLLGLLTDAKDYDEMLEISKNGDNKNIDMLVGDIYGGDYSKIGLKSTTIASSLGKVIKVAPEDRKTAFKQEDIAISLLYMVSNNIGQIAYLHAQAHGIQRIYFSGFYISGHPSTMNTLSYAISFWSKGKMKAQFLRHEGYLGAVGAFLRDPPSNTRLGSFSENFSHIDKLSINGLSTVGTLEEYPSDLVPFPLLKDLESYNPDTSNLSDPALQSYWIDLLDVNLKYLVDIAVQKNSDAETRASMFESMYRHHLTALRSKPNAYGPLTVRSLLLLREQCLREMGFNDIFRGVKEAENAAAIKGFVPLITKLDLLEPAQLVDTLLDNIMAGGNHTTINPRSSEIQVMLEKGELDFLSAKAKIGFNFKLNDKEKFRNRLLTHAYKKTIIFVDNSGADLIFGILPFVRYLLKRGTHVTIAANTHPSVNDVTASELKQIVNEISKLDSIFEIAITTDMLAIVPTGSGSPCLDFSRISEEVCAASHQVDLVIVEGMGRAIHTNFHCRFNVESVKVGVFKNPQIAKELNANMYDGLLLYEIP
ncbi:fumble-domain-containing protein [Globomyces pollinis-pini]|nr:fumble-domain-containing protein [Globomyces pollinis-pini]